MHEFYVSECPDAQAWDEQDIFGEWTQAEVDDVMIELYVNVNN